MGIRSESRILGAPTPSLVRSEAPTSFLGPRANRENTVEGSSQGSAYPGHRSTHPIGVSPQHPVTCSNAGTSWACRGDRNPRKSSLPEAAAGGIFRRREGARAGGDQCRAAAASWCPSPRPGRRAQAAVRLEQDHRRPRGPAPDRRTDRRGRWTPLRPQDDRSRTGGPGGRRTDRLPAGTGPRNAVLHRDPRPFRRGRQGARTGPFRARNHRLQLPFRHRFRHLFRAASL